MNKEVDMTYSFLWDEEPTDEQLQAIMQEVGEDVRRESEQIEKQIKEKLEEEYARVLAIRQKQP
jgi:vacuolar-type H+-ATPase catalytic subunit A/Vma1